MSSDPVRFLEIQLKVHKRRLQEQGDRINELEARNIDLEAQLSHLQEVVDKQGTLSNDDPGPAVDLNYKTPSPNRIARPVVEDERETMRSNRQPSTVTNLDSMQKRRHGGRYVPEGPDPSSEHAEPEPKRRRIDREEVVQSPSSSAGRHAGRHAVDKADSQGAAVNSNSARKDDAVVPPQAPIGRRPQSLNIFRSPEARLALAVASRDSISHGSGARTQNLTEPHQQSDPVVDSELESESSNRFDHRNDVTSRSASSRMALDARMASVEPFDYGVVSQDDLAVTGDRLTLGKRLSCCGHGTVVYSHDGIHYLFPSRRHHPYSPAAQGMPGLFFSPKSDRKLSGAHEVIVGVSPGKYKYMGKYKLELTDALSSGEFKALPRGTKTFWAASIVKQKKYESIRHRLLKGLPYGEDLETDDIIRAYEKGEEKLYVWKMRCIDFNEEILSQAVGDWSPEGRSAARNPVAG